MGCPLCYAAGIRGTSGLVLRAMPSGMWGRRRRALKIYHYRQKVQSHGGHITKIEFLAGTYFVVSFLTRLTSINMTMHNMVRGNFLSIISIFLSKLGRKPYKFFFLASQKLPLTLTEFLKIHIEGVTTIWHRLQSLQHTVHDGYRWPSLLRHLGMEELHSDHASTGWTSCAHHFQDHHTQVFVFKITYDLVERWCCLLFVCLMWWTCTFATYWWG
jgi:hypothetical protein